MIEANISRCGLQNMRALVWDALVPDESAVERADILIADLPCSGLGIMGRKPDIKYNASEAGIAQLAKLQRDILSVVWRYVKPGGRLIFSTCTISSQENEDNAEWFQEHYPFRPVNLENILNEQLWRPFLKQGRIQFLPGTDPADGFFISVFQREE